MKKKYIYDPMTFQAILEKHKIRQVDLQHLFQYKNTITIRKWREGGAIYADKICEMCNAFGIDIHEFFVPDENPQCTYQGEFRKSLEMRAQLQEDQREAAQQKEAAPNIDLAGLLEEIEKAREKERTYQESLRDKDRKNYEEMMREKEERMERLLEQMNGKILAEQREKNDIILQKKELEMKVDELTRQYQELEMKMNASTFKGAIGGIAEKVTYQPKKL